MTHGLNDAYRGETDPSGIGLETGVVLLRPESGAGEQEKIEWGLMMRVMEIPPFPRKFENHDLENLLRSRLSQTIVLWPDQAIPLLGYMGWPNKPTERDEALRTVRSWAEGSKTVPRRLGRIQYEWLRVADVFHCYCDLINGQHQERRGGPSIGKAIELVDAKAKSRGTGAATLWQYWKTYKDVAHLVTAATLICFEARFRSSHEPFGQFGLSSDQLGPLQMVLLLPDLVLAVALEFERYGLSQIPYARTEPALDPKTVWRIPDDVNVAPFPTLIRKISIQDLAILNDRRAGNRGRANRREAGPVCH